MRWASLKERASVELWVTEPHRVYKVTIRFGAFDLEGFIEANTMAVAKRVLCRAVEEFNAKADRARPQ